MTLLLSGCVGLYAERREVERLRLVETMGLDPAPDGLRMSLCSSGTREEGPACYSGAGASLSDALERLRSRSAEEDLFCGHLQHILVGQDYARRGLKDLLSAVCRSSDLRLDLPVWVILNGTAQEAVCNAGDGENGVPALLSALQQDQEGAGALSSAGAILRDLERQGSSLVRALELQPSSEEGSQELTLVPAGYGVLVNGILQAQISPENALAAELFTDSLRPGPLTFWDGQGRAVTLELQGGSSELKPVWGEDGTLNRLEITLRFRAVVLEVQGFPQVADAAYLAELSARAEAELSRRAGEVLGLARELEEDFLSLGKRVELGWPLRGRGLGEGLGPLLPELPIRLILQGELLHSNDIN